MTLLNTKFFGPFAGDAIAHERTLRNPPVFEPWKKGHGYCFGCKTRKPIVGKPTKSWRCDDCKKAKKLAKKSAENSETLP